MISEETRKMDDILAFIITNRYLIGRTSEIVPLFGQIAKAHKEYMSGMERIMKVYLELPHTRQFMDEVTVRKREDLAYFRQKSEELGRTLEEDGLIPMAQEVVNFLNALQAYLSAISGKFINQDGQSDDLLNELKPDAFTLEENGNSGRKTVSLKYEHRRQTGKLILNDLGYKLYTLHHQVQQHWANVVLAYEHLEFLRK